MLSVWAMRHGLFDSVCANPTLYLSFCLSAGSSCADAPAIPVARAAMPAAAMRKCLLSISFLQCSALFSGFLAVSLRAGIGRRSRPADVGGLLPQVSVEAVLAVLAAEPGMLPAGVKALNELAARTVHVKLAEREAPRELHHAAQVVRVDVGRQAIARVVREGQRLLEAVDRHDRDDRPEDLALHDGGPVVVDP